MGMNSGNLPAPMTEEQKQQIIQKLPPGVGEKLLDVTSAWSNLAQNRRNPTTVYGTTPAPVASTSSAAAPTATPQNLATGLQQYGGLMSRMPMSMQRQPQGGLAGANVQPQMPSKFATLARGFQVK